ncbi:MAG TPA: hypothetical protein VF746_24085 [Longimicrobium sp.]|jgi:hypothetical protein
MAPVPHAAYRPAAPRPPEKPERFGWATAAGWAVIVAGGVLFALFVFRANAAAERRAAEEVEVAREKEHRRKVDAWLRDTSASAPVPESAGRPVPTSDQAKRMWVINRMLVDRSVWEREVMERHGVEDDRPPPVDWGLSRYTAYVANARAHPEVGTYLEGRAAAIAEIEQTSAAWLEERIAALARESGMPASEIRDIFPRDFAGAARDQAREVNAMLEIHRHLVRVDPRVQHGGGVRLLWDREADARRFEELLAKQNDAVAASTQARARRLARDRAIE